MSKNKAQKEMKKGIRPLCVYCQTSIGDTQDEVIAKSFYHDNPPVKEGYLVVPACRNCNNNLKSKDDVTLREMAVYDEGASKNPIAQSIFHDVILPALRSNERKPTPLQFNVMNNSKPVSGFTKSGIYVGNYQLIEIDPKRARRALFWVAQGLYYRFTKKYLSRHVGFNARRISFDEAMVYKETFKEYGPTGLYSTESNIVNIAFLHTDELPGFSFTVLQFYGGVFFAILTTPVGYKSEGHPELPSLEED